MRQSPLLRLIAGLETVDGASVHWTGATSPGFHRRSAIWRWCSRGYALYPHMSVYDNMSFALMVAKVNPQ